MVIYGIALVSFCIIIGEFVGLSLGHLIGLNIDVGGIGIAMILLIIVSNILTQKGYHFHELTESGIKIWSALYIPIFFAMTSKLNVYMAVNSGFIPIIIAIVTVFLMFILVKYLIQKYGGVNV